MYLLQHIGAGLLFMLLGLGIFVEHQRQLSRGQSHGQSRSMVIEFVGVVVFAEGLFAATIFFLAYWQVYWYWP